MNDKCRKMHIMKVLFPFLGESIHKLHCNSHIKLPLKRNRVQYQCLKYGFHWVTYRSNSLLLTVYKTTSTNLTLSIFLPQTVKLM